MLRIIYLIINKPNTYLIVMRNYLFPILLKCTNRAISLEIWDLCEAWFCLVNVCIKCKRSELFTINFNTQQRTKLAAESAETLTFTCAGKNIQNQHPTTTKHWIANNGRVI